MTGSLRFCAAVLAGEPEALAALTILRRLPPAEALALLRHFDRDRPADKPTGTSRPEPQGSSA